MTNRAALLIPDWPAPQHVRAVCSTRDGGCSTGVYSSLNLGEHVADIASDVAQNRLRYQQLACMPSAPVWLNQVHGTDVIRLSQNSVSGLSADASVTSVKGIVSTVMTADCLPLLLCDVDGTQVAAVHAGWRGLCHGVIEKTVAHFSQPVNVLAYLGPAIGATAFEVGDEVRAAFTAHSAQAELAFIAKANRKWLADIYLLARQRLVQCGVTQIFGGHYCTYEQSELFFSYRRDGQTGRMASAIWLD
ncbi:peptidoglycan editing factor PgeF [Rheinheimera baltica]|uniref:Purine nucleoside phosphorylase n=1 Tax=Rheinheimera baltica TaxID=67576 RepID=A0ABT9I2B2_9GAMM|nr:peptidoglycan editing factor PgeF [Rheinheimera baltica]MDP5137528.1 peptidoglycan editing factor PgeF [Rheinheimera baltica]